MILDPAGAPGDEPPALRIQLVPAGGRHADEIVVELSSFRALATPATLTAAAGSAIDWTEGEGEAGFAVIRERRAADSPPAARPPTADPLEDRVAEVLERSVNPAVAAHGGRVDLVRIEDGVAHVRMSGGCQGCSAADLTLVALVERLLRSGVPEITGIVDATRHDRGEDPFLPGEARVA